MYTLGNKTRCTLLKKNIKPKLYFVLFLLIINCISITKSCITVFFNWVFYFEKWNRKWAVQFRAAWPWLPRAPRRAAVSQTVKVKAETGPVPKTQPLLDHVQLHWTSPKNDPKSKTWRGRKIRKKERKKRGAPNLISPPSAKNCLPVLTFFFCEHCKRKASKAKSWTWEMWSYRLVCFNQAPGFPINPCSTVQWYVNMDYYCFDMLW